IPSKEWQYVPEGIVVPSGGEYRVNTEIGLSEARWDNPPPPETVIDNRKKQKSADASEASQNGEAQAGTEEAETEETLEAKRAAAFSACTSQGSELLAINIPPRTTIISDWFKEGDLGFVF